MARKNMDTEGASVMTTERAVPAREGGPEAPAVKACPGDGGCGFCIYIGPNIKGLIQTGTIFRGGLEDAYKAAAAAIEKHPKVKSLIVSGEALPQTQRKVKSPGNALYANYQELAGK